MDKRKKIFQTSFLSDFSLDPTALPLSETDLHQAERGLDSYERKHIDWQLAKALKSRSTLLASFAISKAEDSALTMKEAQGVYDQSLTGLAGQEYAIVKAKIERGGKVTKAEYDRLEYLNIVETFQAIENSGLRVKDLSLPLLLSLHGRLTKGLDIFVDKLPGFEPYESGQWRSNDQTRVGEYCPAPFAQIEENLKELITWFQADPSVINLGFFHAALYAVHPFRNGNKRVCRTLEHFLLQDIGYNEKQLYAPSFYYHNHQDRYYKYLVESLYKRDLSPFAALAGEALFFSIAGVIAGTLERKKLEVIKQSGLPPEIKKILRPLVKRPEIKFSRLLALNKRKISRQTFVDYLATAADAGVVFRRQSGRNVYYRLAGKYEEEALIGELARIAKVKLGFLPNELVNYQGVEE